MHVGTKIQVPSQGPAEALAASRMKLIHEQTGDPIAKSTAALFENMSLAIGLVGKDPKAAQTYIEAVKSSLAESTQALSGGIPGRMNQEAYKAILEDQTKALGHLLNGNVEMASFLMETAGMNAHGIYDALRTGGHITSLATQRRDQPSLSVDDQFGSHPARLTEIFRSAYERCTAMLSKAFATSSKDL